MAGEHDPRLERLLFLTDGVYAIALTLLAAELLSIPRETEHRHGDALLGILPQSWPKALGFLSSFTVIFHHLVDTPSGLPVP